MDRKRKLASLVLPLATALTAGFILAVVGRSPCKDGILHQISRDLAAEAYQYKDWSPSEDKCCCAVSAAIVNGITRDRLAQENTPEESSNRVLMLTKEGILDNRVHYFRVLPGSKFIINNVGGRKLQFGPEDPPHLYVTALGEYDCVGPLLPLNTLFPKVSSTKEWWTHKIRPHQKWILNTPELSETEHRDAGFCVTVTDAGTKKTITIKLRVGLTAESSWT